MKKNLFVSVAAFLMAASMVPSLVSCSGSDVLGENAGSKQGQETADVQGKATVKLSFSSSEVSAGDVVVSSRASSVRASSTRASLTANGKQLTDLYIFDYDKTTGKLLQVLHQTSTAEDFAEPSMQFDYGDHILKVIASRSEAPTLLGADGSLWSLADNTAFAPTTDAAEPLAWTSTKTSDTFGATQEVKATASKNQSITIQLERLVAKLVIKNTDIYPDDCSTLQLDMSEYKQWSLKTFSVIEPAKNQRISDVTAYVGNKDKTISYFFLVPDGDGYTTDITLTMGRKDSDVPYSTITVPDVHLQRNCITTIAGSLYNHQAAFSLSLKDGWNEEQNFMEF